MEQSWLPTSTVVAGTTPLPNARDTEIWRNMQANSTFQQKREQATQQGIHEWEFDPMALEKSCLCLHGRCLVIVGLRGSPRIQ
jgi:hypothetical protein